MPVQNVHRIEADIKQKRYVEEPRVTSNDDIAFLVTVTDDGQSVDMAAVTMVVLASTRPDRQTVITTGTKQPDGSLLFELGSSETAVAGQVKGVAQLFDAEGDRISSVAFTYHVYKDPTGNGYIPTEKDKTFIEIVLVDGPAVIQEAKDVTADAVQSVINANSATQSANSAAGIANTAANAAEQERLAIRQEFDEYFTDFGKSLDAESAIYGVYSDGSSSPAMQRIKSASGLTAAIGVNGEYALNDFDTAQIFGEIGDVTDNLGNVFTRIPKHYFRHREGVHPNGEVWTIDEISKTQHAGFKRYPNFWDFENEAELPYVEIGKYLAGYDEANRMTSKKGVYPKVSQNIVQFRDAARGNNADARKGYQLIDIHAIDMLQRLFLIEFGTKHSQSVMYGFATGQYNSSHTALLSEAAVNRVVLVKAQADQYRVSQSIGIGTSLGGNQIAPYRTITDITPVDAANSALVFDGTPLDIQSGYIVYNTAYKTGTTDNVATSSGSMISTTDGKHQMKYRGIESLYGDVYQFVDGVNINDWQTWISDNAEDYASNVFAAPYKQLGYLNSKASAYIKALGYDPENPTARLPVTVGAGSATWYSDYYYQAEGQRVALFGGYWSYGATDGLFLWNLTYSSSTSYLVLGSRLLKKAL